jgi:hypothetical protein
VAERVIEMENSIILEDGNMKRVVVLMCVMSLLSTAVDANIVVNGGFESGTGFTATGWTQNQFVVNTTLRRVAELPHSGIYSMKYFINWTSGSGPKAELIQTTAVGSLLGSVSSGNVDFSFWYRGALGVSEVAEANIKWLNAAGAEIGGTAWWRFTPTGTYQQFSKLDLTCPALTSRAKVTIQMLGGAMAQTGTMYVDDVVLTPEPMTLALLGLGGLFLRRRK